MTYCISSTRKIFIMASTQYKEGLVGRWNESQFYSILTSYCERIKDDTSLATSTLARFLDSGDLSPNE
jgi:hypothetical protein